MPERDDELKKTLATFSDGNGFGDPDARRNAEQRVQILAAMGQQEREEKAIAIAQEVHDIALDLLIKWRHVPSGGLCMPQLPLLSR